MDMGLSYEWAVDCINIIMQFDVFTGGMWKKFWDRMLEQSPDMPLTVEDTRFEALKEALRLWDLRLVPIFEGEEEPSPKIVNGFNAIFHYYFHFHRGFCYRKVNGKWLDEKGKVISVDQCCGYLHGLKESGELRFYAVDGELNLGRDEFHEKSCTIF
ncbi:hypothetical protein NL676_001279 [Syzygium grande]|nr:hypothetical protein NL676_001279 [Syzygium grande]